MNQQQHIQQLIQRAIARQASPEEYAELQNLLRSDQGTIYADEIAKALSVQSVDLNTLPEMDKILADLLVDNILKRDAGKPDPVVPVRRVHVLRSSWFRYAATIIVLLGIGIYFYLINKEKPEPVVVNPVSQPANVPAPSISRATLTLSNGEQIMMDSVSAGHLTMQGNTVVQKMVDGSLVYKGSNNETEILYNTLSVPRGSTVSGIHLSDGSKVFLNAGSSLKYPVAFSGAERIVEITGEAYFEIEKDPSRKFNVKSRDVITEVLGTHFNVNTYLDEEAIKVTLLEGSVSVKANSSRITIKPGEQAAFAEGKIRVNRSVNTDQVVAWKNGIFNFNHLSLREGMKELSRWYNIEIIYGENLPEVEFYGKIQRTLSLKDVLEVLSGMGVHFTIEDGRKLIVSGG